MPQRIRDAWSVLLGHKKAVPVDASWSTSTEVLTATGGVWSIRWQPEDNSDG